MKCIYCNYDDHLGQTRLGHKLIDGKRGEFYQLPIKLEQHRSFEPEGKAILVGCPSCNKVFIDTTF